VAGASERLGLGLIGLGAAGNAHLEGLLAVQKALNVAVRHVCDVYRRRAEAASARAGKVAITQNHEDVLADKQVQAVFIATPDHWHARLILDALAAGKHVYVEAPLGHTIEQAQEIARAEQAARTRLRVQVGIPAAGLELNERVREHLARNALGRLVTITAATGLNSLTPPWRERMAGSEIADPGKVGLDWPRWLGYRARCAGQELAPRRPWEPHRFFGWRCYWDYTGGVATELLLPRLAQILQATGLGYPERVTAAGGTWVFNRTLTLPKERGTGTDDRETPDTFSLLLDYPGGPTVTLFGSVANDLSLPTVIAGHDGTLRYNEGETATQAVLEPQTATRRVKGRTILKGAIGGPAPLRENFVRACRDPKVRLACPVELAVRAEVAVALGVKAYRESRIYGWDERENRPSGS
jgi:predicted dehydrogenase